MLCLILVAFLAGMHPAVAESKRSPAGWFIDDIPEALRLIRTADQVYILPVTCTEKRDPRLGGSVLTPHGDYKHVRPLGGGARHRLQCLLGKESNWFHGFDNSVEAGPEPKNVGFIFRKGKDELVLLCYMRHRFEGTFNGEGTGGSLEEKPSDELEQWKKEYAKQELAIK